MVGDIDIENESNKYNAFMFSPLLKTTYVLPALQSLGY